MTYRIQARAAPGGQRLEVQGLIDAGAIASIRAAIDSVRSGHVRVVLKQGCQIELAVLEQLRQIEGIELSAESPFLDRWLGRIEPEHESGGH